MDTLEALGEIGLGSRLKRLSDRLMKEVQQIYDDQQIDFDPYLFPAFYKIASQDGITNTTLRESLLTSQPAVTQTINKLVQKGLVLLNKDLDDKRKKQIMLSEKGNALLAKIKPLWQVLDETVKEHTSFPANSMLEHIGHFEQHLNSGSFMNSVKNKLENQKTIYISPFQERYAEEFYNLNIEWLETFFYVEDFDKEVLSNPDKYIINPGGHIFFAIEDDIVLGTVALMTAEDGAFELTKMAVRPDQRGKKIGQKLMQYCIDFAKENKFTNLFLYSNTILENAIYIYRKFGFIEIPVEPDSPYERSNIKMYYPLF